MPSCLRHENFAIEGDSGIRGFGVVDLQAFGFVWADAWVMVICRHSDIRVVGISRFWQGDSWRFAVRGMR